MINFNVLGWIDILAAVMLYYTVSPVPEIVAVSHAGFLFLKGLIGFIPMGPNPALTGIYILGAGADILSGAILLVGQPPVLADYSSFIGIILILKGSWSFMWFLN